jgi:hypothetical protein
MNTYQKTSNGHRFRTLVRHVWGDQVAAHRALLRVPTYNNDLRNLRDGH